MIVRKVATGFMAIALGALSLAAVPSLQAGCHEKAVRIRTFFGQPADLNGLLAELPAASVEARVQVFIVEAKDQAEILFLENIEGDQFEAASWFGAGVGDVRSTFDSHFLESRGQACAGELMRQELTEAGIRLDSTGSIDHDSHVNTLQPVLDRYAGQYVRLTVYDPCI